MTDLNCREAARLLSAAHRPLPLTADEAASLERHLAACLNCRNYDAQLKFLRKAAGRFHSEG